MFFSRCLAVPSVAASGGFSSPSVHLAQVLFRNEVECRASGSPTARIYTEDVRDTHHPPLRGGVHQSRKASSGSSPSICATDPSSSRGGSTTWTGISGL